jgi:hypothetical protein
MISKTIEVEIGDEVASVICREKQRDFTWAGKRPFIPSAKRTKKSYNHDTIRRVMFDDSCEGEEEMSFEDRLGLEV